MRPVSSKLLSPVLLVALLGCRGDRPGETTPTITGPGGGTAGVQPGAETPVTPSEKPVLAEDSVMATLIAVDRVHLWSVQSSAKREADLTDPAEVSAFVDAIGPSQTYAGPAVRCMPSVMASFHRADGARAATLSLLCDGGARVSATATFEPENGRAGAVTLAHPDEISSILERTGVWSASGGAAAGGTAAGATVRCGVGGTQIQGSWTTCPGFVGGPCCYQTKEQACSGAGCAAGACALQKSRPPRAVCTR